MSDVSMNQSSNPASNGAALVVAAPAVLVYPEAFQGYSGQALVS
ncbi:MAG TPA: hypothetical protein VIK01_25950 [Polyangiaceae bacterium]